MNFRSCPQFSVNHFAKPVPVRKRHFFAISSSGCGFPCATYGKYDSAETLAFLELIEKLLVFASGTVQFPVEFLDGNKLGIPSDNRLKKPLSSNTNG